MPFNAKKFIIVYIFATFLGALLYYLIGKEHFDGIENNSFTDYMFLSTSSMSTCGFGNIIPITNIGIFVNIVLISLILYFVL